MTGTFLYILIWKTLSDGSIPRFMPVCFFSTNTSFYFILHYQSQLLPTPHFEDSNIKQSIMASFVKTMHHDTYPAISPSHFNLTGRTVFITGASRGIGLAMAVSYTKAGASGLCISARGDLSATKSAILAAAAEAKLPVPKILAVSVDVTSQKSVEAAAAEFAKIFPDGLDILINNAGFLEPVSKIGDSEPMAWWKTFEANVKGTYLVTHSFLPFLLQKSTGQKTIVNLSSIGASMVIPGMSSYNTTKLAVCRFTEYLQAEYADQGIIAISFHPGGVSTELSRTLPGEMHALFMDTAELAGDSVVWLTGERREWLGGRYVDCNWDVLELESKKKDILEKGLLKNVLLQ
jgi:NAD(P)-dependent dehydrogenase (short-subunit alcohol dehydrogenase family)